MLRGGIKKNWFFSEKLRNSEPPPPLSAIRNGRVFSDKEILELARPPPIWRKNPKYSEFFFDKIYMVSLFGKNSPKSPVFYDNTLLEYRRPPTLLKKFKIISVFSDKDIFDWARPPRPPFGVFLKKTVFFFYASPKWRKFLEEHIKSL